MIEKLDAELEVGHGDPLVGRVDEGRASSDSISLIGKNPYATVPKRVRSQWLSVKPGTQIGTTAAPGSSSARRTTRSPAQSGVSIGERVPPSALLAPLELVVVAAEPPAMSASISCWVSPGRSRQSQSISQRPGITLRFSDAADLRWARSSSGAAARPSPRPDGIDRAQPGRAPPPAEAPDRGRSRGRRSSRAAAASASRASPIRSSNGAAFTRALSAMPGIEAWPLLAVHADSERRARLLRRRAEVEDPAAELDAGRRRPR